MTSKEARMVLGPLAEHWPRLNEANRLKVWEQLNEMGQRALRELFPGDCPRVEAVEPELKLPAPLFIPPSDEKPLAELIDLEAKWAAQAAVVVATPQQLSTIVEVQSTPDPGLAELIDLEAKWVAQVAKPKPLPVPAPARVHIPRVAEPVKPRDLARKRPMSRECCCSWLLVLFFMIVYYSCR